MALSERNRRRLLLPGFLVVVCSFAGFFSFLLGGTASAKPSNGAAATTTTPLTGTTQTTVASAIAPIDRKGGHRARSATATTCTTAAAKRQIASISTFHEVATGTKLATGPEPGTSGYPNGSKEIVCKDGKVVSYGDTAITYNALPATSAYLSAGEALYEKYCSSCHLADASGGPNAPRLAGAVNEATINFWVTTGRMPAKTAFATQAQAKPPTITGTGADKIASWVNSLTPTAPYIPTVNVAGANLATGASLFALNCAACHTITGGGDELAYGTFAPSLHTGVSATQIAEAIRTGPQNMPHFGANLSDAQVRDIVAYVTEKIQHPSSQGGFGLGGVGPVAEGFVALLFGCGALMLVCYWIGDRA